MDISYNDLRNREVVNLCDGSKMGHIIDIVFNSDSGKVVGVMVPGEKKIFKKSGELFIPLEKVRRIGDDVVLIRFDLANNFNLYNSVSKGSKMVSNKVYKMTDDGKDGSFIRYRKLDNKKYK